jgi:hypothetical protein
MAPQGSSSIFRVLEPDVSHINERTQAPTWLGSRFGFKAQRSDWFRTDREFSLPCESYDLVFLKTRIVVLCARGFEIMDLTDFKSVTIPERDDPRLEKLWKRCDSCRPLGMFRSNADEFLLCYNGMCSASSLRAPDRLSPPRRVWAVRRSAREPVAHYGGGRMGGHGGARGAPPAVRAALRLALHRGPERRDRAARTDHPWRACSMHLGWARSVAVDAR